MLDYPILEPLRLVMNCGDLSYNRYISPRVGTVDWKAVFYDECSYITSEGGDYYLMMGVMYIIGM